MIVCDAATHHIPHDKRISFTHLGQAPMSRLKYFLMDVPSGLRIAITALFIMAVSACTSNDHAHIFHAKDIIGVMPSLAFMLTSQDGITSTAADFRGKATLLYFGFTNCRDVCPTTLARLAQVLKLLGSTADSVRVLFVSVDPQRDSPAVLKRYTSAFAPQIIGLTGTDEQLTALTKRFRVAYRRGAPMASGNYDVYHSSAIFVFDSDGKARLLVLPSETNQQLAEDLKTLMT